MPQYTWSGVDITGRMHTGKLYARSAQELDKLLFKQEIALLQAKPIFSLFNKTVAIQHKIEFFRQLSQLLNSGVLLPDALVVVGSQTYHPGFQDIIAHIAQDVQEGNSFSWAMAKHPGIFDNLMVNMMQAGQESGNIVQALIMLADYLQEASDFNKKLTSALAMPVITFIFFCVIAALIFMVVMPQFVTMFGSINQLPTITIVMINISNFVRSWRAVLALVAVASLMVAARIYVKTTGQYVWDALVLRLPVVGTIIRQSSLSYFLHAVAMLLAGGVQLLPAIKIAKGTVSNRALKKHITFIEQDIEAGRSLSQAMLYDSGQIFDAHVMAVMRVGEESGQLVPLLNRAAQSYQVAVQRSIMFMTMLINPLLMIILGLFVALLIFAVYVPIFNMSNVVGW